MDASCVQTDPAFQKVVSAALTRGVSQYQVTIQELVSSLTAQVKEAPSSAIDTLMRSAH